MAILERNDKNSVAYILLNSPDTLNSLSDEMLGALTCLLYTSPSPRDAHESRMPSSA